MLASSLNRRRWPLGLVSNCWKTQLDAGVALDWLIDEAEQRGLSVIELRQTCIGDYEDGSSFTPNATRLTDLQKRFPQIQFNIALSLPCFSGRFLSDDLLFIAGKNAAVALAGSHIPHLRLVDLQTPTDQYTTESVEHAACRLREMTLSLKEVGGILSIEHAWQPWSWFCAVLSAARKRLENDAELLRLCFDPCNLLLTEPIGDIDHIVASIELSGLSMIHLKQRRNGKIQPDLTVGDLDWPSLIGQFVAREYYGPILFEIAPHTDLWSHLDDAMIQYF
ncbi:MAG: hypothetical protein NT013_06770 [Planctomycetia bacterium]|nr:hypothetical protein [Planctomycetia bacterium]